MTDQRSINALDVAERYTNGDATDDELLAAGDAAWAAWAAAGDAARDEQETELRRILTQTKEVL